MAFYSEFSGHYEKVFPFRPQVRDFLNRWLPRTGRLLDIGCGTGEYCGALVSIERPCLGIDLDPEMIRLAAARNPDSKFDIQDMETVGLLPQNGFAGIYCIGNVLPHLPAGRLKDFLADIKLLLQPGGIWIFQTVNFDPLQGKAEYPFPVREISEDKLQFHRRYIEGAGGQLLFETRLVHDGEEVFQGEVALFPRTSNHYLDLHRQAGFELRGHFADYSEKLFQSHQNSGSVYVFSAPEVQ